MHESDVLLWLIRILIGLKLWSWLLCELGLSEVFPCIYAGVRIGSEECFGEAPVEIFSGCELRVCKICLEDCTAYIWYGAAFIRRDD